MDADVQRSDARGNRRQLIASVGTVLSRGDAVTIPGIATESGLSRATAYRHFGAPEEAVNAYLEAFIDEFARRSTDDEGRALLIDDLSCQWGSLVEQHRSALVRVRSSEGFLSRVRDREPIIWGLYRTVRRSLEADPANSHLTDRQLDDAAFLWNIILDPREMVDLARDKDTSIATAAAEMTAHFHVLLHGLRAASGT